MPGAFDRAIREDDVRGLFNHSPDMVLGRTKAKTMRLSVDAMGLAYEIDAPDTQVGRDLVESLRRGDIDGSSFSFTTTDEEWRKEGGVQVRLLKGVALYDVGPVTFPAYEATSAAARSDLEARAARAFAAVPPTPPAGVPTDNLRRLLDLQERS